MGCEKTFLLLQEDKSHQGLQSDVADKVSEALGCFCFLLRSGGLMKALWVIYVWPWIRIRARMRPATLGSRQRVGASCWKRPKAAPRGAPRRSPGSASWPPLYVFARHRGNGPEDAQDLVQG